MSAPTILDPARSALLVMDMQRPFLRQCSRREELTGKINSVLPSARNAGALVVFVKVSFRAGYPELAHSMLSDIVRPAGILIEGSEDAEITPELNVEPDDLIISKHRTSALFGNDLNMILRARGVNTLVLTGFSTAGVVLSTMINAFDQDYQVVVPADCCDDPDHDVHSMLMTRLFPRKGTVVDSASLEWSV